MAKNISRIDDIRQYISRAYPATKGSQPVCLDSMEGWQCTRPPHEGGMHVAHGGDNEAYAMWLDDDEGVVRL
jgi:hypothetical protein